MNKQQEYNDLILRRRELIFKLYVLIPHDECKTEKQALINELLLIDSLISQIKPIESDAQINSKVIDNV
jgi:hypothetical protein